MSQATNGGDDAIREMVIIGSGPAGYTAGVYAARAGLLPVLIEGSVTSGGALMTTTEVENYPGFADGIIGPDLMLAMRAQAVRFGAEILTDDAIEAHLTEDIKVVRTGSGRVVRARTAIIATGSAYRELGLPHEKRLSGKGVSWCATCDGFFFRDKAIAVVGGGDTAMEEATFLSRFGSSVTIIHRRNSLRASKVMQQRAMTDPKISFKFESEVVEILGESNVSGVRVRNVVTGTVEVLPVSGLFVAIGHDPRVELVSHQLQLDAAGYVAVQGRTTRTSIPGVFAAGDVVDHSYRQAITAAGSGCAAALDAERHLAALDDVGAHPGAAAATLVASIPT